MAHYKKDGTLDMRFSSSKAAVASGSYSSSGAAAAARAAPSSTGGGYYGGRVGSASGSSGGQLHYKKDGTLDMRYASSKQAVATGYTGGAATSHSTAASARGSDGSGLHYKKDGTLDMRYASSKQGSDESGLHYKKDGTLDMRYASSKQAVAAGNMGGAATSHSTAASARGSDRSGLHYKKDGTLDMRYASSKQAVAREVASRSQSSRASRGTSEVAAKMAEMRVSRVPSSYGIPPSVPTKADGTPDMRTSAAKAWVAEQARLHGNGAAVPSWVPRLKDGAINEFSPLGKAYKAGLPQRQAAAADGPQGDYSDGEADDQQRRINYWLQRLQDERFQRRFESQMEVDVPEPVPHSPRQLAAASSASSYEQEVKEIDASELQTVAEIGRGSFGVVEEALWRGQRVAAKRLHMGQLTRGAKENFRRELEVARRLHLFQHPNLVATLAYCVQPPIIVMELLMLGSLEFVLHYCSDAEVEAMICDGRIKRQLAHGIADGVMQLHSADICHRDLKPQNVLVADNWTAKVGDFGLAELRGIASCTVGSGKLQQQGSDNDEERGGGGQWNPAGTAAYMAPELLDSSQPGGFACDAYSYGVLLNELLSEEQPYSGRAHNFAGRGPFGAANFARLGNRPSLARGVPEPVRRLIERCWHAEPACRPGFEEILRAIQDRQFVVPNGGGLQG